MIKKIFNVNVLLFLVSTILTLLLAEFLVRTFSPKHNIWDYQIPMVENGFSVLGIPNSTFQHTNQANEYQVEVKINQYGFREKKELESSKENSLIILGDSFSFGYGVEEEERFGNVLQNKIKDSLQVYNISFPKSHFLNYQENLNFAIKNGLRGKRIIYSICMENDLKEYENVRSPKPSNWKNIKKWFHNNSSLYAFVGEKIHNSELIEKILSGLGVMNDNSLPRIYSVSDKAIESSAKLLAEQMKDYEVLVLIIPSRLVWVEEHKIKAIEIHQKFIKKLKEQSLNILDMKIIFDTASDKPLKEFYYDFDGHWNLKGHQQAAGAIHKSFNLSKQVSQFD